MEPSNDDNILEVVAVLGASQMVGRSLTRVNSLHYHYLFKHSSDENKGSDR